MSIRIYSNMEATKEAEKLLNRKKEDEVFEVKEKKNGFDKTELGQYFSALSNEAALHDYDNAWMLFGVNNNMEPVGTSVLPTPESRASLKKEIADLMTNRVTFVEIYEIFIKGNRILMFQIPSVPNVVMMYNGIAYGRDGESLVGLNLEKINRIQFRNYDWSNELVEHTVDDLNQEAIDYVAARFIISNPHLKETVTTWNNEKLLSQLGLVKNGKITNAAMLLLGDGNKITESEYNPTITWMLKDGKRNIVDYEHFGIPFILSIKKVLNKVTNLTSRRILEGLVSENFQTYDPAILREALNNAIIHADYRVRSRINVIEIQNDAILFCNPGAFLPNNVENVLLSDNSTSICRNKLLSDTMYRLGMVDTVGLGIKRIFNAQIERAFPLPDYTFDEFGICLKITGHSINNAVTNIVHFNNDLSLKEILSLDHYQKGQKLTEGDIENLARISRDCRFGDMLNQSIFKHTKKKEIEYTESENAVTLSDLQRNILDYLTGHPACSIGEISSIFGIADTTARYNISKLIGLKLLTKTGNGKRTVWRITR